ncbi:MAG: hypothetical protein U0457_05465 [Candidatus Sericytochromatia bacterium]
MYIFKGNDNKLNFIPKNSIDKTILENFIEPNVNIDINNDVNTLSKDDKNNLFYIKNDSIKILPSKKDEIGVKYLNINENKSFSVILDNIKFEVENHNNQFILKNNEDIKSPIKNLNDINYPIKAIINDQEGYIFKDKGQLNFINKDELNNINNKDAIIVKNDINEEFIISKNLTGDLLKTPIKNLNERLLITPEINPNELYLIPLDNQENNILKPNVFKLNNVDFIVAFDTNEMKPKLISTENNEINQLINLQQNIINSNKEIFNSDNNNLTSNDSNFVESEETNTYSNESNKEIPQISKNLNSTTNRINYVYHDGKPLVILGNLSGNRENTNAIAINEDHSFLKPFSDDLNKEEPINNNKNSTKDLFNTFKFYINDSFFVNLKGKDFEVKNENGNFIIKEDGNFKSPIKTLNDLKDPTNAKINNERGFIFNNNNKLSFISNKDLANILIDKNTKDKLKYLPTLKNENIKSLMPLNYSKVENNPYNIKSTITYNNNIISNNKLAINSNVKLPDIKNIFQEQNFIPTNIGDEEGFIFNHNSNQISFIKKDDIYKNIINQENNKNISDKDNKISDLFSNDLDLFLFFNESEFPKDKNISTKNLLDKNNIKKLDENFEVKDSNNFDIFSNLLEISSDKNKINNNSSKIVNSNKLIKSDDFENSFFIKLDSNNFKVKKENGSFIINDNKANIKNLNEIKEPILAYMNNKSGYIFKSNNKLGFISKNNLDTFLSKENSFLSSSKNIVFNNLNNQENKITKNTLNISNNQTFTIKLEDKNFEVKSENGKLLIQDNKLPFKDINNFNEPIYSKINNEEGFIFKDNDKKLSFISKKDLDLNINNNIRNTNKLEINHNKDNFYNQNFNQEIENKDYKLEDSFNKITNFSIIDNLKDNDLFIIPFDKQENNILKPNTLKIKDSNFILALDNKNLEPKLVNLDDKTLENLGFLQQNIINNNKEIFNKEVNLDENKDYLEYPDNKILNNTSNSNISTKSKNTPSLNYVYHDGKPLVILGNLSGNRENTNTIAINEDHSFLKPFSDDLNKEEKDIEKEKNLYNNIDLSKIIKDNKIPKLNPIPINIDDKAGILFENESGNLNLSYIENKDNKFNNVISKNEIIDYKNQDNNTEVLFFDSKDDKYKFINENELIKNTKPISSGEKIKVENNNFILIEDITDNSSNENKDNKFNNYLVFNEKDITLNSKKIDKPIEYQLDDKKFIIAPYNDDYTNIPYDKAIKISKDIDKALPIENSKNNIKIIIPDKNSIFELDKKELENIKEYSEPFILSDNKDKIIFKDNNELKSINIDKNLDKIINKIENPININTEKEEKIIFLENNKAYFIENTESNKNNFINDIDKPFQGSFDSKTGTFYPNKEKNEINFISHDKLSELRNNNNDNKITKQVKFEDIESLEILEPIKYEHTNPNNILTDLKPNLSVSKENNIQENFSFNKIKTDINNLKNNLDNLIQNSVLEDPKKLNEKMILMKQAFGLVENQIKTINKDLDVFKNEELEEEDSSISDNPISDILVNKNSNRNSKLENINRKKTELKMSFDSLLKSVLSDISSKVEKVSLNLHGRELFNDQEKTFSMPFSIPYSENKLTSEVLVKQEDNKDKKRNNGKTLSITLAVETKNMKTVLLEFVNLDKDLQIAIKVENKIIKDIFDTNLKDLNNKVTKSKNYYVKPITCSIHLGEIKANKIIVPYNTFPRSLRKVDGII